MSVTYILRCDECGEKLVSRGYADKDGWVVVYLEDENDVALDFCDQQCMLDYFSTKGEEDE